MKLLDTVWKDKLYSVYEEPGDDTFHVGYFISSDEATALFNIFTTRGYEDGLFLTQVENIYRLDCDDRYTNRIAKLAEIHQQEKASVQMPSDLPLLIALFQYAQKNDFFVSVELDSEDLISGSVREIGEEHLLLDVIDEDGISDGTSLLLLDSVVRASCNSGRERNIQALFQRNR